MGGCWLRGEHPSLSLLFFFGGGGIMWVWVAGFGIWVPNQPASVVAPQLPGKQVSHPCDPHTFYR